MTHVVVPDDARASEVAADAGASTATAVAEATWLILLVALPAVFNPFGALGFEPTKTSLLRAAAAILALAWLFRRLRPGPSIDVLAQPVVRAGLVFLGLAAFSTAASIEPALSFFGSFDRGMGWLTLAAGGVLLLSAADLFADPARRERAITALSLGAILPCAYLLVQRTGLDPFTWTTLGEPGSSLASPTFLGGYLVMVAPFVLYRAIAAAHTASVIYAGWLAVLLVVCAVTVLTTIRGPILGLCVGILTFAVVAARGRRRRRLEVAGGLGVLLVALALAVATTGSGGTAGLQRFLNIARGGDSSVERLTVWRDAMRLPLSDPARSAIGFGPETQSAVLEQGEATVRLTQSQRWDRAHDLLLDTWLTGGVLGVAALIWLLWAAASSVWRARDAHGLLPAAMLAALAGHVVEVSFAFHTVATSALFWMLLGLAASLSPRWVATPRRGRRPGWVLAGLVVGVALVPLLVTPAIADALYGQARRTDYLSGAQLEELAGRYAPWVEELPRAAALDWQRVARIRDDAAARSRAQEDLLLAARLAPAEPLPDLRLARWFLQQGDLAQAEQACQRALASGPYRAAVWDACADVSAAQGRSDVAPLRRARAEELRHPLGEDPANTRG